MQKPQPGDEHVSACRVIGELDDLYRHTRGAGLWRGEGARHFTEVRA
jgi:hypothetical protein